MTRYVLHDFELNDAAANASLIGGKAAGLLRLTAAGERVPPFFVVTTEAWRRVAENLVGKTFPSADPTDVLLEAPLPTDLAEAVLTASRSPASSEKPGFSFDNDSASTVSVRSSAVCEDGSNHSFAGIFESVLGVDGGDDAALLDALRRVWASNLSPRATTYRRQRGLEPAPMAVVVQRQVDAVVSGVMFTSERTEATLVSATYGLGEGLVARGFAADEFRIDRATGEITAVVAEKVERLDAVDGRLVVSEVSDDRRTEPSLTDDQLRELATAAERIEAAFGSPQDVEFCFDREGQLFVLQSRPITAATTSGEYGPADGNHVVWDNSNIVESYAGVTSPMTFSFIRRAYSIVYRCFAEVMGIPPRVVDEHGDTFDNMLGLFRGRVFYNLRNWYRLVRLFPGYAYNRRFMESMMGLKEPLFEEDETPPAGFWRRWFVEFPGLLKLLGRSTWNFWRIEPIVDRFQRDFRTRYEELERIDFDSLPPHEILATYERVERELLRKWRAPIVNDFFVMVFYGLLRKLCRDWCGDETGTLQNGLLAGEGGLESDEPAKLLLRMAAVANNDPELRELILEHPNELLPGLIADDERFVAFRTMFDEYLDRFGFRGPDELKLEIPSYREEPHRLFGLLRHHLRSGRVVDVAAIEAREVDVRRAAEQRAEEAISRSRSWFSRLFVPKRRLFRRVLRNARLGVRNRENTRFSRTRIYGVLRRMLLALGRRFEREGILDATDDVFLLTIDEVRGFVRGTAVSADLRGIAAARRAEYDRYRNELPPPDSRFETYGMALHRNAYRRPASATDSTGDDELSGIGCCPGIVEGVAAVVRDPREELPPGDVLVAERTDPGWVALYPAFRGILVERGSVLSHSAIVAREMGIPTTVGVSGLLERIQTSDCVRMDGGTGRIEVLAPVSKVGPEPPTVRSIATDDVEGVSIPHTVPSSVPARRASE